MNSKLSWQEAEWETYGKTGECPEGGTDSKNKDVPGELRQEQEESQSQTAISRVSNSSPSQNSRKTPEERPGVRNGGQGQHTSHVGRTPGLNSIKCLRIQRGLASESGGGTE